MTLDDIDLFEVNEAFAVVAAKFIRDLELDPAKVNVNGGAMALGHPIAATGSMLIGTLLDELERRDLNTGLITMCTGGGMAPQSLLKGFRSGQARGPNPPKKSENRLTFRRSQVFTFAERFVKRRWCQRGFGSVLY